jgi:hypothetical protein
MNIVGNTSDESRILQKKFGKISQSIGISGAIFVKIA